ncbi:hypothetical protein [Streptomyces sp. NPDC002537]
MWPTSATQLAPWHTHVEQRARQAARALAARPVALVGVGLPQGARLLLLMCSAAHDETHAVHDPRTFDHRRTDTPPTLNFGAGVHYCPGARYTRLVTHHTVTALTHALPRLTLTTTAPVPRPANLILRRPTRLHATW